MQPGEPDLVISGREIYIDLNLVTIREWRALFKKEQPQDVEDAVMARVCGLSLDEYLELGREDWRRLVGAVFAKATRPLEDPPSAGASTSD